MCPTKVTLYKWWLRWRDGHQQFPLACVNVGGWRQQANWIYEWNLWNMTPWVILCCEIDELTGEGMVSEVDEWVLAEDPPRACKHHCKA